MLGILVNLAVNALALWTLTFATPYGMWMHDKSHDFGHGANRIT